MVRIRKNQSYEEARKQRIQHNLKRFQDLGISTISKNLFDIAASETKSLQSHVKNKSKTSLEMVELRRSSRARNPVSYIDDVEVGVRYLRKSTGKVPSGQAKSASYEEREYAVKCAEKVQSNLKSGNPSFIKSMVRSHVYSCFWLGLPTAFCKEHLPPRELKMVLEDEHGSEQDVNYLGNRTGLSGGWKAFALDHGLDDGDALVFELTEPARFKVYIVKASEALNQDSSDELTHEAKRREKSAKTLEVSNNGDGSLSPNLEPETDPKSQGKRSSKRKKQD